MTSAEAQVRFPGAYDYGHRLAIRREAAIMLRVFGDVLDPEKKQVLEREAATGILENEMPILEEADMVESNVRDVLAGTRSQRDAMDRELQKYRELADQHGIPQGAIIFDFIRDLVERPTDHNPIHLGAANKTKCGLALDEEGILVCCGIESVTCVRCVRALLVIIDSYCRGAAPLSEPEKVSQLTNRLAQVLAPFKDADTISQPTAADCVLAGQSVKVSQLTKADWDKLHATDRSVPGGFLLLDGDWIGKRPSNRCPHQIHPIKALEFTPSQPTGAWVLGTLDELGTPAISAPPTCECGGDAANTPHAHYCPKRASQANDATDAASSPDSTGRRDRPFGTNWP